MLDLSTNNEHDDGFFAVKLPVFKGRLVQISKAAQKESAHAVFLALEAKGEILPYFMNEPKTFFGSMHQDTLYSLVPKLFADKVTQSTLQATIERLQQDPNYRSRAYFEYDSHIRPYSPVHEVDIVDMLYSGSDPKAIRDLKEIMTRCEEKAKPVHDRISLGYIYLIARQKDPEAFFRPEQDDAGVEKRNSLAHITGCGHFLQERVFRALLDFGQYFEDRYRDFKEIFPELIRH